MPSQTAISDRAKATLDMLERLRSRRDDAALSLFKGASGIFARGIAVGCLLATFLVALWLPSPAQPPVSRERACSDMASRGVPHAEFLKACQ
jgi:hypothetical protein